MISPEHVNLIEEKNILITGGTGTVGRDLIRRILPLNPAVVRIFSRDENKQYFMRQELKSHDNVRFLIGDVRDPDRLKRALEGIDIVFHLAALKHVESCEYNPFEAIKTNINGTQNLIDACLVASVKKVVFSSTDKAVNPTNAMGASKLMAEKLMVAANYSKGAHKTIFTSVRFGNVLASSGSVIPTFIARIKNGEPIEITDTAMTRFITTFSDAVNLMLTALVCGEGGEVFISKMPVINIKTLADTLITELSRRFCCEKIETLLVGKRAGEKLYEEMITEEESERTVDMGDYLVILPTIGHVPKKYSLERSRQGAYTSRDIPAMTGEELFALLDSENMFDVPELSPRGPIDPNGFNK